MQWWALLGSCALVLVVVDRLGQWAERRGWIYWRKRARGSISEATFGPLFEAFQPAHQYVVEERERRRLQIQQTGRGEPDEREQSASP